MQRACSFGTSDGFAGDRHQPLTVALNLPAVEVGHLRSRSHGRWTRAPKPDSGHDQFIVCGLLHARAHDKLGHGWDRAIAVVEA
jgi:hypothetical protein